MVGEARRFTRGRQRSSAEGKLSDNGGREVLVTDVEGTMTRVGKVNQMLCIMEEKEMRLYGEVWNQIVI